MVDKYGKAEHRSLCPTDPYLRARVDNMLHFDHGTLFNRFAKSVGPIFRGAAKGIDADTLATVLESLGFLEAYLTADYVVGNNVTVADFSIVSTTTTIFALFPNESTKFPKILAWIERLSKLPYYEEIITTSVNEARVKFAELLASANLK